jgi:hypothetical protein
MIMMDKKQVPFYADRQTLIKLISTWRTFELGIACYSGTTAASPIKAYLSGTQVNITI